MQDSWSFKFTTRNSQASPACESVWSRLKIEKIHHRQWDIEFQFQSRFDVMTEVLQLHCQKDTSDGTKPVGDTVKNTSLALKIFFCGKCNSEIKKNIYIKQTISKLWLIKLKQQQRYDNRPQRKKDWEGCRQVTRTTHPSWKSPLVETFFSKTYISRFERNTPVIRTNVTFI